MLAGAPRLPGLTWRSPQGTPRSSRAQAKTLQACPPGEWSTSGECTAGRLLEGLLLWPGPIAAKRGGYLVHLKLRLGHVKRIHCNSACSPTGTNGEAWVIASHETLLAHRCAFGDSLKAKVQELHQGVFDCQTSGHRCVHFIILLVSHWALSSQQFYDERKRRPYRRHRRRQRR